MLSGVLFSIIISEGFVLAPFIFICKVLVFAIAGEQIIMNSGTCAVCTLSMTVIVTMSTPGESVTALWQEVMPSES